MKLEDRHWCFGCGENNPIGLHLKFTKIPQGVKTVFIPEQKYEGYREITHGGIISALLDETLAWMCLEYSPRMMTISLEIKFFRPVRTGKPVTIEATLTRLTKRYVYGIAKTVSSDGRLLAQAKGKMARLG
jgi:uncharacterized protein (TIGR00369 family)